MCFFAGGMKFSEQGFGQSEFHRTTAAGQCTGIHRACFATGLNSDARMLSLTSPHATGATQLNSSLLTISVIAVLLPAAFHFTADSAIPDDKESKDILAVSHGVSLDIWWTLKIYGC